MNDLVKAFNYTYFVSFWHDAIWIDREEKPNIGWSVVWYIDLYSGEVKW
jgi:hypothetical protein